MKFSFTLHISQKFLQALYSYLSLDTHALQVVHLTTTSFIVLGEGAQVTLHLLAIHIHIVAVEQNKKHTTRESTIAGDVDPLVSSGPLNADVARTHDALLARVQDHLENTLNDNAVVETDSAVQRGLHARSKVD